MKKDKNKILKILDKAAENYEFPMGDNIAFYQGDLLMIVFTDKEDWLITIQELAYSIKDKMFIRTTFCYGSNIENDYKLIEDIIFEEYKEDPFFMEQDSSIKFILNPSNFSVLIKNNKQVFSPTEKEFAKIGINLKDENMPNQAKIIRIISKLSEDIFLTNQEILKLLNQTKTMYPIIKTNSWQNPDLAIGQLPSEINCFQSLAAAIQNSDPNLYDCNKKKHNTNWSNWEWYKEDY